MNIPSHLLAKAALLCTPFLPMMALTSCGDDDNNNTSSVSTAYTAEEITEAFHNDYVIDQLRSTPLEAAASDASLAYRVNEGDPLLRFSDYDPPIDGELGPGSVLAASFDADGNVMELDEEDSLWLFENQISGNSVIIKGEAEFNGQNIGTGESMNEIKDVLLYFNYIKVSDTEARFELDTKRSYYKYNGVTFKMKEGQVFNLGYIL